MNTLGLLFPYFLMNVKNFAVDRGSFITYGLTILCRQIIGVSFIWIVFTKIPTIAGWSFNEVLFLIGFFETVQGLFFLLFAWTLWFPSKYIVRAELDLVLTLPIPSYLAVFLREFGRSVMEILSPLFGIVIMIVAVMGMPNKLSLVDIPLIGIYSLAGAFLIGGIATSMTCISFWHKGASSWMSAINSILDLGKYPLSIYSNSIRFFLTYIIPLGFISFFQGASLLRPRSYLLKGIASVPIALLVFGVGIFIWKRGLLKYDSSGH
ncbi:MAG: ABC-2 family transporter protein [Candidatus Aegiribacteria sp.]|nr:ABC-2 family transporter protein [Candidatus Aegiribacteria sp.]